MRPLLTYLFNRAFVLLWLILLSFFIPPVLIALDLNAVRTASTEYQLQFQVWGKKIYYVWHEYNGPFRQIFTAEMNIDGTGRGAVKRTSSPYDKFEPLIQVGVEKAKFVWRESDGSHFQI